MHLVYKTIECEIFYKQLFLQSKIITKNVLKKAVGLYDN